MKRFLLIILLSFRLMAETEFTDNILSTPTWTTATRPNCAANTNCWGYNTDILQYEAWYNGAWRTLGGNLYKDYLPSTAYAAGEYLIQRPTNRTFYVNRNFTSDATNINVDLIENMTFTPPPDLTTAILDGGVLSYAGGYNVSAGHGYVVKNNNTSRPVYIPVFWNAATNVTLSSPTGWNTFIVTPGANPSLPGTVSSVAGEPNYTMYTSSIVVGTAYGPTNETVNLQGALLNHGGDLRTMMMFFGMIKNGLIFSGNTNQTFATSSGIIHYRGIAPLTENPNIRQCAIQPTTSFKLYKQNTLIGTNTVVPTTQYDLNTVLTAISGTNWSCMKLFLNFNCGVSVQYCQGQWPTLAEAINQELLTRQSFVVHPDLAVSNKFMGLLFFKNASSNFADPLQTQINNCDLFGCGIAGTGAGLGAAGDVAGPPTSSDKAITRFNGGTGKIIQNSGVFITDFNDITDVANLTVEGRNTNTALATSAALNLFIGRDSGNLLNGGQTSADISIEKGASGGGFKHYITSLHSGTSANNRIRFYLNTGSTAGVSTAPGTGNTLALNITPTGVGILSANNPTAALDVTGAMRSTGSLKIMDDGTNSILFPLVRGSAGQVLTTDGLGLTSWTAKSLGDVISTGTSLVGNIAYFTDATGKTIADANINQRDLDRLIFVETASFNPPNMVGVCSVGSPGANPFPLTGNANGVQHSNGCQQTPFYTPAIGPRGTPFYAQNTNATGAIFLNMARTNLNADLNMIAGSNHAFVSDGTTWNYEGSIDTARWNDLTTRKLITQYNEYNATVKGLNYNQPSVPTSAWTFMTGRTSAGALNSPNQVAADVAFEYGANNGGYKHYISTQHSATPALNNLNFWINDGAQTASTAPGTGNALALSMTGAGTVGIGTKTPYRALDVVGDITTSVPHGATSEHNAAELIGLSRIGHTSASTLAFAGMGITVKDVESDGVTARPNNAHIGFYTWGYQLWSPKEVVRISERGRLGINTTNPTSLLHVVGDATIGSQGPTVAPFNTGVARLTLTGANANASGPHQSWNTDSDVYPQRHFLNWTHDNIWDCFDCYYGPDGTGAGGNNIRGSNGSSAFRWLKNATDLILQSDPAPVAGAILAPTNKFWINENGPAHFSNTVTAGPAASQDTIGNGDLSRIAIEETKSFNPTVLANCSGWPGGCGTNPLGTHPTANGMYLSNANWLGTLYTPAVAAAGTAFYYQTAAQSTAGLQPDRTNLTGSLGIVNGWTYTFVSDGTTWNYVGAKTNGVFNAARVWPTSTTTIGFGTTGQVLTTNGAGSLSWTTNAALTELEAQKKTIADLIKRIEKLEAK